VIIAFYVSLESPSCFTRRVVDVEWMRRDSGGVVMTSWHLHDHRGQSIEMGLFSKNIGFCLFARILDLPDTVSRSRNGCANRGGGVHLPEQAIDWAFL
jgi:hypothetical protein